MQCLDLSTDDVVLTFTEACAHWISWINPFLMLGCETTAQLLIACCTAALTATKSTASKNTGRQMPTH